MKKPNRGVVEQKHVEYMRTHDWRLHCESVLRLRGRRCDRCRSTYKVHVHPKQYVWVYSKNPDRFDALCAKCWGKETRPTSVDPRGFEKRQRSKAAVSKYKSSTGSGPSFDRSSHIPLVGKHEI